MCLALKETLLFDSERLTLKFLTFIDLLKGLFSDSVPLLLCWKCFNLMPNDIFICKINKMGPKNANYMPVAIFKCYWASFLIIPLSFCHSFSSG